MSSLTFEASNAKKLAEELAASIIEKNGFNALSKTDFYDFVLYLLDKYSNEHFLSSFSNQKNALLLKVKPDKIKASKFNIFLKFFSKERQKEVLHQFVTSIINNPEIMQDVKGSSKIQITIENPTVHFCLDGKMKAELGISPNTSFNNEIAIMEKEAFFKVLRSIVQEDETLKKNFEAMEKEINPGTMGNDVKTVFRFILDTAVDIIDIATPLPAAKLRDVFMAFHKRASALNRRKSA